MATVLLLLRGLQAIHGEIAVPSTVHSCSRSKLQFVLCCSVWRKNQAPLLRWFSWCGPHPERHQQLCNNRLEKKVRRRSDFGRKPLSSTSQFMPTKSETQQCSALRGCQRSLGTGSSRFEADIGRLCDEGRLDKALDVLSSMDQHAIFPSVGMYRSLFMACARRKDLVHAKRVHAHLVKHGLVSTRIFGDYAVRALVKCGGLEEALQLFHVLPQPSVYSWTAIISGYANAAKPQEALSFYQRMQEHGVKPDASTFVSLLKACGTVSDLEQGKRIHAEAVKYRCEGDLFVCTCLVNMYGKCGSITDAMNVFDGVLQQDVILWNAMLSAYAEQGQEDRALELYGKMLRDGVSPDICTFLSVLQVCGMLAEKEEDGVVDGMLTKVKSLQKGREIHADAQRKGYDACVFVGNTLISLYGKCGSIVDARIVFNRLSQRTVVSWNSMVAVYAQQGQAEAALHVYELMVDEWIIPNDRTFVRVLQACGMLAEKEDGTMMEGQSIKVKTTEKGKAIHAFVHSKGYTSDVFVASTLVSMYAKCGSIADAGHVFGDSCWRNVVLWNAMLTAYAQHGLAEIALQLYDQMCEEGVSPDVRTIVSTLQACGMLAENKGTGDGQSSRMKVLGIGKVLHAYTWNKGYNSDIYVGNTLVSMYSRCGSVIDAWNVFDGFDQRNVVAWTAMIGGHVEQDQAPEALLLYQQMREEGVSPDDRTFVSVLQACVMLAEKDEALVVSGQSIRVKPLEMGKLIHADARRNMYDLNIFVGSTLVSLYAKCGSCADALSVFDMFHCPDVVLWNAMLVAYTEQGQAEKALQLFEHLLEGGISPGVQTFVTTLQACCMLAEKGADVDGMCFEALGMGKAVHADLVTRGYGPNILVGNTLVSMYRRCSSILDAQNTFDELPERDVVTWTAMLAAYTHQGQGEKALQLYKKMQDEGVSPNHWTFVSALQACGMLAAREGLVDGQSTKQRYLEIGRAIHADVLRKGLDSDVFVGNSLVSMYRKCRSLGDVHNVFEKLIHRDVVSWNEILAAYVEHGQAERTLKLYEQMQDADFAPNARTFVSALQACGMLAEKDGDPDWGSGSNRLKSLERGREVHLDIKRRGYDSDVFVGSSLITMYGKSGSTQDAWEVFEGLPRPDVPAWNAMLAVYVEQGHAEKAWQLYTQMEQEGVPPDDITFVCILQVCSSKGSLAILRQVHRTVVCATEKELSSFLASSLISAYGRCASMKDARSVFDGLSQPDIVSWNALIAGYARQGNSAASFQGFGEMLLAGEKPNRVTFLSLLSACSHAGLVDKGVEYFESMSLDHGITPDIEHYVTMVDLLGRAGYFTRVEQLLSTLPVEPNLALWLCLLAACRTHGKVALGRWAFDRAVHLQPKYAASYVLMLNIYTDVGLWDRAREVKELRRKAGGWKKPGQTWVESEQKVYDFVVRDSKHPDQEQVHELLQKVRDLNQNPPLEL